MLSSQVTLSKACGRNTESTWYAVEKYNINNNYGAALVPLRKTVCARGAGASDPWDLQIQLSCFALGGVSRCPPAFRITRSVWIIDHCYRTRLKTRGLCSFHSPAMSCSIILSSAAIFLSILSIASRVSTLLAACKKPHDLKYQWRFLLSWLGQVQVRTSKEETSF